MPLRILCLLLLAMPAYATSAYLSAAPDIPLAPGLVETRNVVFDKPQGRIVRIDASHAADDAHTILAFYRAALPNLGWAVIERKDGVAVFRRGDEILRVTMTASRVVFDIAPARR